MIYIQPLAMIKRTHSVPEDHTIYEDLPVYLAPCSQIVQSCAIDKITKKSSNQEGQHAS